MKITYSSYTEILSFARGALKGFVFGLSRTLWAIILLVINTAVFAFRKAAVYAQRVDWLLSGDDSEETFMQRLFDDLKDISQGRQVDYSK